MVAYCFLSAAQILNTFYSETETDIRAIVCVELRRDQSKFTTEPTNQNGHWPITRQQTHPAHTRYRLYGLKPNGKKKLFTRQGKERFAIS